MGLIRLTDAQASIVEIHVLDSAHDDERQDWWPTLDGNLLIYVDQMSQETIDLFIEAANSEENEPGPNRAATAIANKIRKVVDTSHERAKVRE